MYYEEVHLYPGLVCVSFSLCHCSFFWCIKLQFLERQGYWMWQNGKKTKAEQRRKECKRNGGRKSRCNISIYIFLRCKQFFYLLVYIDSDITLELNFTTVFFSSIIPVLDSHFYIFSDSRASSQVHLRCVGPLSCQGRPRPRGRETQEGWTSKKGQYEF